LVGLSPKDQILGADFAGIVGRSGQGVLTKFKVGDRVI